MQIFHKQFGDSFFAHAIKIVQHTDFSRHEAQAGIHCHYLGARRAPQADSKGHRQKKALRLGEANRPVRCSHADGIAGAELAGQYLLGQGIFHLLLDGAL